MMVSPRLFGYNLECTRRVGYGGLYAEMLSNNKFAAGTADFYPVEWNGLKGWGQCTELIHLRAGHSYELTALGGGKTQIRVLTEYGGVLFEGEGAHLTFYSQFSVAHARFEAVSDGAIRYVSMRPADSFHGCRIDVLEAFRALHPGTLRVPGGCYAERYWWKDGLKPLHERDGIHTTKRNLFSASHDYDGGELNIDDYAAVSRFVGAELQYTVRLQGSDPSCGNDPRDAADLVEYCNGGTDTVWGAKRAARGCAEPYNVRTWYIGNELAYLPRSDMKNAESACAVSDRFVRAMRAVDPNIETVISTGVSPAWDAEFVRLTQEIDCCSQHDYLIDVCPDQTLEALLTAARRYTLPKLERAYEALGRRPWYFDEWNAAWGRMGSGATALYAAGVMTMLIRNAERLNIRGASYFCPINEGAIRVYPDHVLMAPDGEILSRMAAHAGGELIETADEDAVMTGHGGFRFVSVINTSTDAPKKTPFAGEYEIVSPDGDRVSVMRDDGALTSLPPASVAFVREKTA